jgi:hypothetical protein
VATAGSCFAQHIARHLRESGYNYYVEETGHPLVKASLLRASNYGVFSARYGNVYTARQLLQLLERAYGIFEPDETVWKSPDGRFCDPFRPEIQPGDFVSEAEMFADREQHLAAVRAMFEGLDVLVFTLGLTECWRSKSDGAVFPLCPGVAGGHFDENRYEFYNQRVQDVHADLNAFLLRLAQVNPRASVVLTVSPVPLVATAQPGAHVLSATTYSKSVLRVAADMVCNEHPNVHYFPSYEIISNAYNRGAYYGENLRDVVEDGVSHVMRVFFANATNIEASQNSRPGTREAVDSNFAAEVAAFVELECEEELLDDS